MVFKINEMVCNYLHSINEFQIQCLKGEPFRKPATLTQFLLVLWACKWDNEESRSTLHPHVPWCLLLNLRISNFSTFFWEYAVMAQIPNSKLFLYKTQRAGLTQCVRQIFQENMDLLLFFSSFKGSTLVKQYLFPLKFYVLCLLLNPVKKTHTLA